MCAGHKLYGLSQQGPMQSHTDIKDDHWSRFSQGQIAWS